MYVRSCWRELAYEHNDAEQPYTHTHPPTHPPFHPPTSKSCADIPHLSHRPRRPQTAATAKQGRLVQAVAVAACHAARGCVRGTPQQWRRVEAPVLVEGRSEEVAVATVVVGEVAAPAEEVAVPAVFLRW